MRTPDFLYVEYADGEKEYYDLKTDPYELDNIVDQLNPAELTLLHRSCSPSSAATANPSARPPPAWRLDPEPRLWLLLAGLRQIRLAPRLRDSK